MCFAHKSLGSIQFFFIKNEHDAAAELVGLAVTAQARSEAACFSLQKVKEY